MGFYLIVVFFLCVFVFYFKSCTSLVPRNDNGNSGCSGRFAGLDLSGSCWLSAARGQPGTARGRTAPARLCSGSADGRSVTELPALTPRPRPAPPSHAGTPPQGNVFITRGSGAHTLRHRRRLGCWQPRAEVTVNSSTTFIGNRR